MDSVSAGKNTWEYHSGILRAEFFLWACVINIDSSAKVVFYTFFKVYILKEIIFFVLLKNSALDVSNRCL